MDDAGAVVAPKYPVSRKAIDRILGSIPNYKFALRCFVRTQHMSALNSACDASYPKYISDISEARIGFCNPCTIDLWLKRLYRGHY